MAFTVLTSLLVSSASPKPGAGVVVGTLVSRFLYPDSMRSRHPLSGSLGNKVQRTETSTKIWNAVPTSRCFETHKEKGSDEMSEDQNG